MLGNTLVFRGHPKIRVTLGGSTKCHTYFFAFWNIDFIALGSKTGQDKASKDTNSFNILKLIWPKNKWFKKEKKHQKSVMYYLTGSLITLSKIKNSMQVI